MNDASRSFEVLVEVAPLSEVSDPQGATIERALPALGFVGISDVRVGKAIRFRLTAENAEDARRLAEQMCERLLSNPVIERASVEVNPG